MKIQKKSKKGLFFTISIIFLIPAIITIWTLSSMDTNLEHSFILDRIYDLSASVQGCMKEIFYYYAYTNISIDRISNKINITFTENISANKSQWGPNFNQMMANFESFAEADEQSIHLNSTMLQDKETPSYIEPYNITYSRRWLSGNGANVSIKVSPNSVNFNAYDITVNSSNVTIGNVTSRFGTAGSFLFTVTAVDNYGNKLVRQANVDPSSSHQIQIFFNASKRINITLMNNNLEIWTNSMNSTIISTKVGGLSNLNERVKVTIFKDAINVSFPAFKAEKISSVYLAEKV